MTMTVCKNKETGTFSYEVHNGFDLIEFGHGYPDVKSAGAQARICYHELHRVNFDWNKPVEQFDYISDEDVFAELGL